MITKKLILTLQFTIITAICYSQNDSIDKVGSSKAMTSLFNPVKLSLPLSFIDNHKLYTIEKYSIGKRMETFLFLGLMALVMSVCLYLLFKTKGTEF